MAKRTRVTTSVSTLVTDLVYLRDVASMAGRKDFLASIADLTIDVNDLVKKYNQVRGDLNALKVTMRTGAVVVNEEEEEKEIEIDA